jgi:hypothetical protein
LAPFFAAANEDQHMGRVQVGNKNQSQKKKFSETIAVADASLGVGIIAVNSEIRKGGGANSRGPISALIALGW